MHSRRSFGQLLPVPPFSQLSRFSQRLLFVGVLGLGVAFSAPAGLARAQNASSSGPNPTAERFTQDLVAQTARYHRAGPADQARLLSNLLTVAADRQQLLASLIENDPGEVLRVALPAAIRASLPPAVQAYVEEAVEVEGELEVQVEDRDRDSRLLYFLKSAGQRFSLHFAADPPKHLLTDTQVRAKGIQVDGALALASGDTSIEPLALNSSSTSTATTSTTAVLPNTFGAQRTLVILVNFQDNPTQPYTLAYASSVIFGTTSNFFLENSYQQTWLTGDVFGWYTIPLASTTCNGRDIASYAEAAATAAGANLSNYTHRVYAFPQNNACGYWGAATVGGNPSRAWINGSLELAVTGHELGHNLGLEHSHSLNCTDGTSGTNISPNCTTLEYGDGTDIMGWSDGAHFMAFQKDRLGWLNYGTSPPIVTLQTAVTGTYTLEPYETLAGGNPKALKILKNVDSTTSYRDWYYVEFRRAIGFDSIIASGCSYDGFTCISGMNYNNILDGVLVHWGSESSGHNNWLLDMTPETYQLYTRDPALTVGRSFSNPDAGVTITLASVDSTKAVVRVALSAPACYRSTPTAALSPSQSQAPVGTPVTYTLLVTNHDTVSCGTASFTLQASVADGWTAVLGAPTLTLAPGQSGTTTLTVTSPSSATPTYYSIWAAVTNSVYPAYFASTSATYVIASGLNVSVSTDKASYSPGQTVSLTAKANSGGSPVVNAGVTFTITKSNGALVTKTATTGPDGSAVFKFKLKPTDPTGTYQVRADATSNALSGSAATSFTVQ